MAKFFAMAVSITLLLLACTPQVAPATTPPVITPQEAPPLPVAVTTVSAAEATWAKIVEAARKEGRVNAYVYTWVGDVGLAIAKAFKERYGITVEIITGRGAEFNERIKAEKRMGKQVGDMTEGNPMFTNGMKSDGLLVSVADELPSLREKGVWWVEPTVMDPVDKANLTWRLMVYSPYINTKLIKPNEAPQSWKDLLEPRLKGKMGMTEPRLGSALYQLIVVFMDQKIWDEDSIKALYQQNLNFYVGQPGGFLALSRGEIHLMVNGTDASGGQFALEGAPIQAIGPKEGVLLSTGSVAAISGGPNPNAARVFLNWLFSPEGQSVAGKVQGNKMVRKDVSDFRPEAAQAPITTPRVITIEQLLKAEVLFKERWFDKLVGR